VNTFHARLLRARAMMDSGVDAVQRWRWSGEHIVYPGGYDRGERAAFALGVWQQTRHYHRPDAPWMRLMVRPAPGRTRRCP